MLEELYDAVDDEAALAGFASTIAQMCGARSANLIYARPGAQPFQQISYFPDEYIHAYVSGYLDKDPWRRAAMMHAADRRALAMDGYVPPERFVHSAIYNDLLKPLGDDTGRCMGIEGMFDGAHLHIAVHRPLGGRPFSAADCRRLEQLSSHVANVMRLRSALDGERTLHARTQAMLDATGTAVLLVDAGLKILDATEAAIAILDCGDGISARDGRLVVRDSDAAAALRRTAARLAQRQAVDHSSLFCPRPSDRPGYRLLVAPAAVDPRAGFTIIIDDPESKRAPSRLELLSRAYRLTGAEMLVTDHLLKGASLEDIAAARQVSIETVRAQLKSIFHKTQTHRQLDLVRLFS